MVSVNSAPCLRCESLPEALPAGPGTLYINPPLGHTANKIATNLRNNGLDCTTTESLISISIRGDALENLIPLFNQAMTAAERRDSKVLFLLDGQSPSVEDLVRTESLDGLMARLRSDWLIGLIRNEQLFVMFQPILTCSDRPELFAHECLLRGRDADRIVPPMEMFELANRADLLFQLDRAARQTAIRESARHQVQGLRFVNFTPSAIYQASFCLQSTMQTVKECGMANHQVVFEVTESTQVSDPNHLHNILAFYRDHGFGIALDDIGSGYSSLNLLHHLRPDYIKLDMELIRGVTEDPYKAMIARKLLETAHGLGIRSVAEGVETIAEYQWLRENGGDLMQGYYFARPACPPPVPQNI